MLCLSYASFVISQSLYRRTVELNVKYRMCKVCSVSLSMLLAVCIKCHCNEHRDVVCTAVSFVAGAAALLSAAHVADGPMLIWVHVVISF